MKKWITAAGLLLSMLPAWAKSPLPVTLAVDDVPVVQVLQTLAELGRYNLVVAPEVSGTLSLHLVNVPWQQALQTVLSSAELIVQKENSVLQVHTQAWGEQQQEKREADRAKQQSALPLVEKSVTLRYAEAEELARAGGKLLSPQGTMMADKRMNRLLLRDNAASLQVIARWIAEMDLPVAQVELSAHIVTINEKSLRELGVKWRRQGKLAMSPRSVAISR